MSCQDDALLGAYLDGELDLVRGLEVEEHARGCLRCAAELERQQQLGEVLSAAPYYPASPELRARLEPRTVRRPTVWLACAAAVGFAVLAVSQFSRSPRSMESEVVDAHRRSLLANHLLDVAASGHRSVKPWFAGKLDFALNVDDISGRGFEFEGGRLDYLGGRPVAALVYRRGPHVVNVFVWPAGYQPDRTPASRVVNGYNIVEWRTEGMNWWAISDLNLNDLEELPLCPCFMPVHETLQG